MFSFALSAGQSVANWKRKSGTMPGSRYHELASNRRPQLPMQVFGKVTIFIGK
jgi:hypothetical protein